jgi:hypothetical protein
VSDPSTPTPSDFLSDPEGVDARRSSVDGDDPVVGSSPELGDDVSQQSATGMSGGDADQHAGEQAPASEGRQPGGP